MSCGLQICLIIAPDISLQKLDGGLALSMAKSYWHGALCSAHELCTRPHLGREVAEGRTGTKEQISKMYNNCLDEYG